jgi:DNA-binding MarR family transcriptional regulator
MNEVAGDPRLAQLVKTLRSIEGRLEASLEHVGLSLSQFGTLYQLVAAGEPLPLSALAERRACVRSNMTQLVDRLEAEKLVRRVDDPRDRRSVLAELTEEGRARYDVGLKALRAAEREIFAPLTRDQREQFFTLLGILRDAS